MKNFLDKMKSDIENKTEKYGMIPSTKDLFVPLKENQTDLFKRL